MCTSCKRDTELAPLLQFCQDFWWKIGQEKTAKAGKQTGEKKNRPGKKAFCLSFFLTGNLSRVFSFEEEKKEKKAGSLIVHRKRKALH